MGISNGPCFFCMFAIPMDKLKNSDNRYGLYWAIIAFVAAFAFFQFLYPYHLIRREQMNLFMYDWDYIVHTYRGTGWLVRFVGDFLEQFFHLPVAGPVVTASLLTCIGYSAYSACRTFLDRRLSFALAVSFYFWSFLRETGNLYMTCYTLAVLGYILLIRLAFRPKNHVIKAAFATLFLALGIWAFGAPADKNYGRLWNMPKFEYERVIGLDAEVARGNWDKVIELSNKDLYMTESSYCYNLAQAMKGNLGNKLFCHSQNGASTLLMRIAPNQTIFRNCLAGEAWFHLGEMTIAEQSAIIALQASPRHTGARYIRRLAQINLVTGDYGAAGKYLTMLEKTLFYRNWARQMMPGNQSRETVAWLSNERSKLMTTDFVHHSYENTELLSGLLDADPTNIIARNYLLCLDLLDYDLGKFIQDYSDNMINARIYHEAVLIWLSQQNRLNSQETAKFGIKDATVDRMNSFFRMPDSQKDSYWYYYLDALED